MEKIKEFTKEKEISFIWESSSRKAKVTIKTPDFSHLQYSKWGDWGPMYTIKLTPQNPVLISYFDVESQKTDQHLLREESFEFNSPMIAKTREVYPFYFKINDALEGVEFSLFVNRQGKIEKVEALNKKDKKENCECLIE